MASDTTENAGAWEYHELLKRYQELELRVTQFSAIEQQLIHARDQVDRERDIYSRMYRFNTSAFKKTSGQDFANLVAESLVDIFEVELGFFIAPIGGTPSDLTVGVQGGSFNDSTALDLLTIISSMTETKPGGMAFLLTPKQLVQLEPMVSLKEALAIVLRDEQRGLILSFLAGNTNSGARFRDPIQENHCEAFAVLAQQVSAHLSNRAGQQIIRQQMEQIRSSEEQLALAIQGADLGLWDWNIRTGRVVYSERWAAMLGYEASELAPCFDTWRNLLAPGEFEQANALLQAHFSGSSVQYEVEIQMLAKNGSPRWILSRGRVVERDSDGKPLRVAGTHLDITERHQHELRIKQERRQIETIINSTFDGIIALNEQQQVVLFNAAAQRIFNHPTQETLKRPISDFLDQKSTEKLADLLRTNNLPSASGQVGGAMIGIRADGSTFPMETSITPCQIDNQQLAILTCRDQTEKIQADRERERLEHQLRQSQKMEAIGQLAGGIAHDFNNIMMVVQGNTSWLLDCGGVDPETKEMLTDVLTAAERASKLTRQLLTFSRKQVMRSEDFNLNEVIHQTNKILTRTLGEHITIRWKPSAEAIFVRGDISMIEQVLLNLALNARDAMPKGGTLTLATALVKLDAIKGAAHPDKAATHYGCLRVSDTGCGISPAHLPQIFEPFFTTKEVGSGTGLGLATVHGIVHQHGGWIECTSELGRGTEFKLFLPIVNWPAGPADGFDSTTVKPIPGGHETILLVEDDSTVMGLVSRILEKNGYTVFKACDGPEALKVWANQKGEIEMLLTDMVMPGGLSGRELALRLLQDRPSLKVIYSSGYSLETTQDGADWLETSNFLPKPYMPQVLLERVRDCFLKPSASSKKR